MRNTATIANGERHCQASRVALGRLVPGTVACSPEEGSTVQVHHVTLFVRDTDRSLRFYRDALGLAILVDREFDGDWPTLLGVASKRLRAVILGDPKHPHVGQVELITFAEPVPDGPPPLAPATGTVVLAFLVDLDAVLPALLDAGATDLRRTTLANGHAAATVRDPDAVLVELLDVRGRTGTGS